MPFKALPSLVSAPCSGCGGDGYLEDERGSEMCGVCWGLGTAFVCPDCKEVPNAATDLCGCIPVVLSEAA